MFSTTMLEIFGVRLGITAIKCRQRTISSEVNGFKLLLREKRFSGLISTPSNISFFVSSVFFRKQLPCDLHRFFTLPLPKNCSSKQPRISAASISQTHLLLQVINHFFSPPQDLLLQEIHSLSMAYFKHHLQ